MTTDINAELDAYAIGAAEAMLDDADAAKIKRGIEARKNIVAEVERLTAELDDRDMWVNRACQHRERIEELEAIIAKNDICHEHSLRLEIENGRLRVENARLTAAPRRSRSPSPVLRR